MAEITFKNGDYFSAKDGYGVVTTTGMALMLMGGGRVGWETSHRCIPEDAIPINLERVPSEAQLALEAVSFLLLVQRNAV